MSEYQAQTISAARSNCTAAEARNKKKRTREKGRGAEDSATVFIWVVEITLYFVYCTEVL